VQIDEPYMQARPEKARQFGLKALNRALEGISGTTAVHICFGYAAVIHVRPSGYSFLGELCGLQLPPGFNRDGAVQSRLFGAEDPARKTIILGVIDLNDMAVETPGKIAARIRRALPSSHRRTSSSAPDCG